MRIADELRALADDMGQKVTKDRHNVHSDLQADMFAMWVSMWAFQVGSLAMKIEEMIKENESGSKGLGPWSVESVAGVIRGEIKELLSDYTGDFEIIADDAMRHDERAMAEAKLHTINWLQETWNAEASTSEERLEGVARAVLGHIGSVKS